MTRKFINPSLDLALLREANRQRLPLFKNALGKPAHSEPDGSDWTPAQWLQAVIGELGEFANKRKKFERGDITFEEYEKEARKELADVLTYLDILAMRALDRPMPEGLRCIHPTGIDLGEATIEKWNEISRRVDCSLRIEGASVVNAGFVFDPTATLVRNDNE